MDAQEQRRLLELAAKAAGYVFLTNGQVCSPGAGNFDWNPLTNDGDALRLAVQLKLNISLDCAGPISVSNVREGVSKAEDRGDDPCTATRLAIVRAAAAIGRGMGTKP